MTARDGGIRSLLATRKCFAKRGNAHGANGSQDLESPYKDRCAFAHGIEAPQTVVTHSGPWTNTNILSGTAVTLSDFEA